MAHPVHYSSAFASWRTPRGVFDDLHAEFDFTVDGCSSDENALLERHWTERDEPLLKSWTGERVFINPPYGRQISRWMEKAWTESAHALIVALVPSRTDTAWWHDYVMRSSEIRFVRGRLEFAGHVKENPDSHNAPFPSAIVVWQGGYQDVALSAELRVREASQIPVIPRAAYARLKAAEARVAELEAALRDGATVAAQYMDTERGDLDGWIDRARALAGDGGGA